MKVLAIASIGGHWIQLLRLMPAFDGMEIVYVSTNGSFASMVKSNKFYAVSDSSRWDKWKLIVSFFNVAKIVLKEKPDAIITTGAAPGLMGILVGKIVGARTIWVDSIANVDELSMSGKIALKVADRVYTQWPEIATSKVIYSGKVIS